MMDEEIRFGIGKWLALAWWILLLSGSSVSAAQEPVSIYYLKIETTVAGRKVIYISADEITASEPSQFIVQMEKRAVSGTGNMSDPEVKADQSEIFSEAIEMGGLLSLEYDESGILLFPDPVMGLVKVQSLYNISRVKISGTKEQVIEEKAFMDKKAFVMDISSLKNGFYVLEITLRQVTALKTKS